MFQPLISVAPLMGYTDPYFCQLMHWIAPDIHLYTEMLHANAVIFADKHKQYGDIVPAMSLQLGRSDPETLAQAAQLGADFGYTAINLNLGCPSPRVQKGAFGACLMKEKKLVAECVSAMQTQRSATVSIKCRIGVDEFDSESFFYDFIGAVHETGCHHWVVHARKALLSGLSPKQNREIPPLCYERVWRLKAMYPHAHITINGGIDMTKDVIKQLSQVDGVMLGRWAIANPWGMRQLQLQYFPGRTELYSREEVIARYLDYINKDTDAHASALSYRLRHLSALFAGEECARAWRQKVAQCQDPSQLLLSS